MFHWLGLIITVAIWLGLALLLTKWHDTKLGSISAHGSSNRGAALLFRFLLVVGGAALYIWLVGWFVPHLHLGTMFVTLLTIVMAYQILTGLNNPTEGLRKDIHNYTAQTMSLLYVPLAVLIIQSSTAHTPARIVCIVLLTYMVNSYVIVEVMKKFRASHLVFQLLYIVVFQVLILVAAYAS